MSGHDDILNTDCVEYIVVSTHGSVVRYTDLQLFQQFCQVIYITFLVRLWCIRDTRLLIVSWIQQF